MDGATTISKLIKQILDLTGQILILSTNNIELLDNFVVSSLQTEHLRAVVAGLGPAGVKLGHQIISLALPLSDNLVKVVCSLLGDDSSGMSPLVLHGDLLQLGLKAVLALLGGGDLGVEGVNGLLSFVHAATKLGLATFQLVNSSKSLSLVLGFPQLDLGLS